MTELSAFFEDVPEFHAPEELDAVPEELIRVLEQELEEPNEIFADNDDSQIDEEKKKKSAHAQPPRIPDLVGDVEWKKRAKCRPERGSSKGLEYYQAFDQEAGPKAIALAKQICHLCVVKGECLEYALENSSHVLGVWGGFTERERQRVKNRKFL